MSASGPQMRTWCLRGDMMRQRGSGRLAQRESGLLVPRAGRRRSADANRSALGTVVGQDENISTTSAWYSSCIPLQCQPRLQLSDVSSPASRDPKVSSDGYPSRPWLTLARSPVRHASSVFRMPAMSPTMTEGGIANWKKSEGESFAAGDVLLEIETDKATIDVEAQDDGVMGKILTRAGENKVPVGQVIAILAEEGDDLASIEVPSDLAPEGSASSASAGSTTSESKSTASEEPSAKATASATAGQVDPKESKGESNSVGGGHHHEKITHSKPLFPSVLRL